MSQMTFIISNCFNIFWRTKLQMKPHLRKKKVAKTYRDKINDSIWVSCMYKLNCSELLISFCQWVFSYVHMDIYYMNYPIPLFSYAMTKSV
ncbi:hypothetical protein GDO81_009708 [Engystomops pustulosus]|uniref:Uncharacterized protein n=1 Tax=Engystomops pustulosus TaxID=76066 RepID=A0AAV7BTM7_ENGPU|nr:hypothetical protein GDO81_009708 [Engystomops pustulosus]